MVSRGFVISYFLQSTTIGSIVRIHILVIWFNPMITILNWLMYEELSFKGQYMQTQAIKALLLIWHVFFHKSVLNKEHGLLILDIWKKWWNFHSKLLVVILLCSVWVSLADLITTCQWNGKNSYLSEYLFEELQRLNRLPKISVQQWVQTS